MYIPKLTVALSDDKSSYIGIDKADLTKKYYCPCCGGEVFPKALNSTVIKMHFCHRNKSCNNEDIRHFLAKWDFVNKTCIDELDLSYNKAEIEKSFQTKYGKYTPDVTLYLEDGTQIFLEIKNTNPKTSDYILKWCELGCDVIEYDIKNNKFAYLFYNKEFCQKYKITKGEKCQKELLEYIRDNNINEQRFQRLYKFWLACRSKSSNDTLKSLIWEMNIEDSIWCVSQLNKVNCCNETAKTLTSFIKERMISLYQREILNLIRYNFCSYYSHYYDIDGNKIAPYVEPIYNRWFYREINEENTRMYTCYLSHLDWNSTNISYVKSTKIYLRIFFEYLLLYKNNKSIIDINNNDIQDFKKFLNKLSISSNQYRCVIGSLYGIIRWKDELKSDCINRIRDLCEEYNSAKHNKGFFSFYDNILKKFVTLRNKLLPIKSDLLIDSKISKKELNMWLDSDLPDNYMLPDDLIEKLSITTMEKIEKIIFGMNVFKKTIIDELVSLTNLDVDECINCIDSLIEKDSSLLDLQDIINKYSISSRKPLYDFIYCAYKKNNSIKKLSIFVKCVYILNYDGHYSENLEIIICTFSNGVYTTLKNKIINKSLI